MECTFCFLCLKGLRGRKSQFSRDAAQGVVSGRKRNNNNDRELNSIRVLMTYLLNTVDNKHGNVLKGVLKLTGVSRDNGYDSGHNHCDGGVDTDAGDEQGVQKCFQMCQQCLVVAGRILELHLELEKVQMKLVQEVKIMREAILRSSGWLGGTAVPVEGGMDESEVFENFMGKFFEPGVSLSWQVKESFKVLKGFQAAVAETDKSAVQVPLVYLEKYSVARNSPMFAEAGSVANADFIVKTEPISDDEDMTPLEPEVGFLLADQEPGSPQPDPNVKSKPKPKSIKRKRGRKSLLGPRKRSYKKKTAPKAHLFRRISDFYHCSTCNNFKCRSLNRFEQHLRDHETPEKSFHCDQCPHHQGFSIEQHYTLHRRRHEGYHKLKCDVCQEFINAFQISDHMKTHGYPILPCSYCSQCLPTLERHMAHLKRNHTGVELRCEVCETLFKSKLELMEHLEEVHKAAVKRICEFEGCNATFYDPVNLAAHQSVHTGRFTCPQCGKCFTSQYALGYHVQRHAGKIRRYNYYCDQCPEVLPTRATLYRHKVSEHGAAKLTCETCGKEYTGYEGLHNHRKVAHDGKGNPCPLCDKVLPNPSQLKLHKEKHHSAGKNYVCEECGMSLGSTG